VTPNVMQCEGRRGQCMKTRLCVDIKSSDDLMVEVFLLNTIFVDKRYFF